MYRLLMVMALCLFGGKYLIAQQNSKDLELECQRLFEAENWSALLRLRHPARTLKADYFNMHYRFGVACFKLRKYHLALEEFQQAYRLNRKSGAHTNYLYHCYLLLGQEQAAATLSRQLQGNNSAANKGGVKKVIDWVYLEGGAKLNSLPDSIDQLYFGQVALAHTLHPRLSLLHAYSRISGGAYWGSFEQHQYYLTSTLYLGSSWTVQPFVHLLNLQAKPHVNGSYYLAGMALKKQWINWEYQVFASSTDLGGASIAQYGGQVRYYPWHNTRVHFFAKGSLQQQGVRRQEHFRLGSHLAIGQKTRLQISYYRGNSENFQEENGYLINNTIDRIDQAVQSLVSHQISKRFKAFLIFNMEQKEEAFFKTNYQSYTLGWGLKTQW